MNKEQYKKDWISFKDRSPSPGKQIRIRNADGVEQLGAYTSEWIWVTLINDGDNFVMIRPTHWSLSSNLSND